MSKVKVRYAPSPTGIPHIGNIRTALFNFLFAQNQRGQFILRIEDTDKKRLVPESLPKIKESLRGLSLLWDEEYQQSKRLAVYQKHLTVLRDKNLVYQDENAWRFKISKNQNVHWLDTVHGDVEFSSNVIEDFVIVKSDGFPTYHFASVVDDHDMQISHVIRGDEWISSTPKHLLLYQALGWNPPIFVHIPPILGPNKKKLSKREGARSVIEYIKDGYLPEALINFLALLGWMPPPPQHLRGGRLAPRSLGGVGMDSSEVKIKEQELFTLDELIKLFSLDRLNKNSPIFNLEKLNWFNKKYLQKLTTEELTSKIRSFTKTFTPGVKLGRQPESTPGVGSDEKSLKVVDLVRDRLTTLADFDKYASVFFEKGSQPPPPKAKIESAKKAIELITDWNEVSIVRTLDQWIENNNLESSDFKNTLRLSVFADNTPPIYQSLAVLSKEEVLARIDDALKKST